ncbi:hypothetical protein [Devosia sp. CN2-171]|uniref:hypothetical protein n=1 Tax=Devosia sp. CN2-171 TaxID=3400909 RepID=UPI003BF9087E
MRDEIEATTLLPREESPTSPERLEAELPEALKQIIRELEAIPLEAIEDVAALDELEAGCLSCS